MSIYKERLFKLADFLDTVPVGRFNLGRWVGNDWKGMPDLSCGTTACSLGWATTIPEFRELGLCLGTLENHWRPYNVVCLKDEKIIDGDAPFRAANTLFGLTEKEYDFLFIPSDENGDKYDDELCMFERYSLSRHCTPYEAARHIRYFAEHRWP